MRPLSCIKLDEQKSEHSIQGQPYFLAQTKINLFRLFWDSNTPSALSFYSIHFYKKK
jgi:hypothetical protein